MTMKAKESNGKPTTPVGSTDLLASLFAERGEKEGLYAKLWESDPEKYGADTESIADQKGRAAAWKEAAEILRAQAG